MRVVLTKNDNHPEPRSSAKTSSWEADAAAELPRARRKMKFKAKPVYVPTSFASRSLVSISSESHKEKSLGFSDEVMRSHRGFRRTSLGISTEFSNRRAFRVVWANGASKYHQRVPTAGR